MVPLTVKLPTKAKNAVAVREDGVLGKLPDRFPSHRWSCERDLVSTRRSRAGIRRRRWLAGPVCQAAGISTV